MIIEYCDELYPERLRDIENPPSRLYTLGNVDILNDYGIAVVGSRTNTHYGEIMCKTFTKDLVKYNLNIISGLAKGIDSIAHNTCLKNSGKTIAVLPCGLKNIYPTINIPLAQKILENGGVLISEYEDDTKADSKKFRERNRIVAGLAIGTLVIEAGERSGTSITANHTVKQGKQVFAVPSSLENIKGKTTNNLIKKGAKLVTKVEDILDTYKDIEFKEKKIIQKEINLDIPQELLEVYKVIRNAPIDANQISMLTGLSIGEVNYKTMMLELENKIITLPGQRYIRKEDD